jgi:hypothetical protein
LAKESDLKNCHKALLLLQTRLVSSLGLLDQRLETGGVINGYVGQNLPVKINASAFKAVDEQAIGNLRSPARRVDTHDPQRAEIALLQTSTDIAIAKRLLDSFLGRTVQFGLGKKVTLSEAKGFVAIISPTGSSFYSWHVFSLLVRAPANRR